LGEGIIIVNRRDVAKEGYLPNSAGEPARWVSLYGSVTFNLVGRELPWGGMNEAGLVVAGMSLEITGFPADDARYPVGSATWTQYVLDTCATVEEVIAAQDSLRLKGDAVHFLVADESGACVAVEYLGGKTILYSGENLPVRALANASYLDCLKYIESGVVPEFNPGASAQRVAAAAHWSERWDQNGDIAPSDWALGILTEAVVDPKTRWKSWFGDPYTRWSVVYDIPRREVRFRTVDHEPVRRFALSDFDFACDATVLMLDVNAKLNGSVADRFIPYDAGWNYRLARDFLDDYGSSLADDQVRELMAFLEGFSCGP
jgi:choloylglycine hydrolase